MDKAELAQINNLIDEGIDGFREGMSEGRSVDECMDVLASELAVELEYVNPSRMAKFVAVAVRRLAVE